MLHFVGYSRLPAPRTNSWLTSCHVHPSGSGGFFHPHTLRDVFGLPRPVGSERTTSCSLLARHPPPPASRLLVVPEQPPRSVSSRQEISRSAYPELYAYRPYSPGLRQKLGAPIGDRRFWRAPANSCSRESRHWPSPEMSMPSLRVPVHERA